MSNTNFEQIFEQTLETYIKRTLIIEIKSLLEKHLEEEEKKFYKNHPSFFTEDVFDSFSPIVSGVSGVSYGFSSFSSLLDVDNIDFRKMLSDNKSETFSEMLLRLIKESGEKNSTIYTRANIDRRHFSKIANRDDYQPSKQTVLAFAIALKLNFEQTKDLLAVAGFTLSKTNLTDVIISAFIEYKIFDVDKVNQILYKYNQPLLGG